MNTLFQTIDIPIFFSYSIFVLNFFQKFREVISHPTHSRTMMILIGLVLLAGVSLTIVVSQQKQTIRQRASEGYANPACKIINSISDCAFSANSSDVSCEKATGPCKIGNTIYECKKQQ